MKILAILMGKLTQKLLRILKRGGGNLPGVVALKLCPTLLGQLHYPKDIIIVTGTNGKSTITNMLYAILTKDGRKVVCNREGNNLKTGVASILLENCSWNGTLTQDAVVLEVDELSVARVMEELVPSIIVVNNFFRDQLDRAGEMENIVLRMEHCLVNYEGHLVLNGDDPSVSRLALSTKARVTYFGFEEYEGSTKVSSEASEGRFCPICSKPLNYAYYQYSHIGRFSCSNDLFGHHKLTYLGKVKSLIEGTYEVNGKSYSSSYHSLYAFYNELAAISVSRMLLVSDEVIEKSIATFTMNNGRMETYTFKNQHTCLLNLAKNPTGQNESMKVVALKNEDCVVALLLNDLEADGQDVSWIHDAQMELLCKSNIKRIYTSGTRMYDMALCVKYTGYEGEIIPIQSFKELARVLSEENLNSYTIANYTALQPFREALKEVCQ